MALALVHSCRVEVCGGKYEEMECFCDEITIMTVPPPGGALSLSSLAGPGSTMQRDR